MSETSPLPGIFVSLVTWNSSSDIIRCLEAVFGSQGLGSLRVGVWDNASSDGTPDLIRERFADRVELHCSSRNIGFCGGHNALAAQFLHGPEEFFLILNPDVRLAVDTLRLLADALRENTESGSACPLLLRGNADLDPLDPPVVDAAGMFVERSLRHFDRGSGDRDTGRYEDPAFVFGGSGACLLLRRSSLQDALVRSERYERDLFSVYPCLEEGFESRAPLFDEAFFAYREDAELAWRMQRLGWSCCYVPSARAVHRRVVVPERRKTLPPELNRLGVRNRFLLQWNHYSPFGYPETMLAGFILRNVLVVGAVLVAERTSRSALSEALRLFRRGRERYRLVELRAKRSPQDVKAWFSRKEA